MCATFKSAGPQSASSLPGRRIAAAGMIQPRALQSQIHSPSTANAKLSSSSRAHTVTWAAPAPRCCMWRSMRASRRSREALSRPSASSMGVRSCLRAETCKLCAPKKALPAQPQPGRASAAAGAQFRHAEGILWHAGIVAHFPGCVTPGMIRVHIRTQGKAAVCDRTNRAHPHHET